MTISSFVTYISDVGDMRGQHVHHLMPCNSDYYNQLPLTQMEVRGKLRRNQTQEPWGSREKETPEQQSHTGKEKEDFLSSRHGSLLQYSQEMPEWGQSTPEEALCRDKSGHISSESLYLSEPFLKSVSIFLKP